MTETTNDKQCNTINAAKPIHLDWQNIHTVFLDMDGTLLDLHFDNYFWLEYMPVQYAHKHHISIEQAKKRLTELYHEMEGTLDWYCLDHWQQKLDMDIVALKHQVADKIAIRANVQRFLDAVNSKNNRVILLTNAHRKTVELKFSYTRIENSFDRIITSHDLGLAKEQAGFWDRLQTVEPYEPEHTLFIDDNMEVLAEAERHGIAHLLTIQQPDSQQPPNNTRHYTAIECFSQLLI